MGKVERRDLLKAMLKAEGMKARAETLGAEVCKKMKCCPPAQWDELEAAVREVLDKFREDDAD